MLRKFQRTVQMTRSLQVERLRVYSFGARCRDYATCRNVPLQ
jgi:hypothetical protein